MNSRANSPVAQLKMLGGISHILAQCIYDLKGTDTHRTPIYNLDFSLLAAMLFPGVDSAAKSFLPNTREIGDWIVEHYDNTEPYVLAVSGAMYFEFLDQLHHRVESLHVSLPRYTSENFLTVIRKELLQQSQELIDKLTLITQKGTEAMIVQPTERFLKLIKESKLKGLGDFLQMPSKADLFGIKQEFDQIVNTQKSLRLASDIQAGRSVKDSEFHYKMDAINICLSRFFAKDLHSKAFFVTPSVTNLKSCKIDHDLVGRHMLVPLFLKNVHDLEKTKYLPDKLQFLVETLNRCEELKKKLEPYQSSDDIRLVPPVILIQLKTFYREYYGLLSRTRRFDPLDLRHDAQEELTEIISSRTKLQEHIEITISKASEAAMKIQEHEALFGISYLEAFELEDDPIYKKIRNDLLGR